MKVCLLLIITVFFASTAFSQRGNPPKEKTRITHITKYPQHLDFIPEMVKLLNVPDGWDVKVAASGLGKPRMMLTDGKGRLYITRRDGGDVLLLSDNDGDHVFEDLVTVAADFPTVHGIALKDRWIYLCNNNELRRYPIKEDGTLGPWEALITDLPDAGQHPNRTIGFGPNGKLYISVGTLCNDCKEADPEVAAMLEVDPTTWKRTIYATGLRNTIGFDWHPTTKEFWGMDNGGDAKGNKWPPEELNLIVKKGVYGYPFAYGKQEVDKSREDPAGDVKEEWVKGTVSSTLEFGAHMAPIDFKFFPATAPAFSGDALVCWHGSWNRSRPVGFKVQRVHFNNGKPVKAEDFLTGFLKPGFLFFKRKARFGRPAGIAMAPDGAVYISDDVNGVIYAVTKK